MSNCLVNAPVLVQYIFTLFRLRTLITLLRVPYLCHFDSTSFVLPIRPKYGTVNRVIRVSPAGIRNLIGPYLSCRHFVLFIKKSLENQGTLSDGGFRLSRLDLIDFISRTAQHLKKNSLPTVLRDLAVLLFLAKRHNKFKAILLRHKLIM